MKVARLANARAREFFNANPAPEWADGTVMGLDARIGGGFALSQFAAALGVPVSPEGEEKK